MDREFIFWQNYLNLENKFFEISKYIYITDSSKNNQMKVFSLNIANLLIETCSEIESLTFYLFNKLKLNEKITEEIHDFDNQCLKEIDIFYGICNKVVYVANPIFDLTDKEFKPLENIYNTHSSTYVENEWNKSYNDLKHDKNNKLDVGTIINSLHALGALFLLNVYLKNQKMIISKKEIINIDKSFGSKIFSLKLPKFSMQEIRLGNTNVVFSSSESPFKIKLSEQSKVEMDKFYEIIDNQIPGYLRNRSYELYQKFINFKDSSSKNENYPANLRKLIDFCILNLSEEISTEENFEKKKELLINSKERNCRISKLENISNTEIENANQNDLEKLINIFGTDYAFYIWENLRFREKIIRRDELFYFEEFELSIF